MEKKYQIFISSTYEDLKEERKKVQDTILSMYQFPIGMEMFSAADEEQWEIIKETIDSSDYYVLIIGHRYGSVIEKGPYAGISYTQKKFRYALKRKVPVLVFLIDGKVAVTPDKMEQDDDKRKKLKQFIEEVKKGRIVQWWTSKDDLANKVMNSLNKQISKGKRFGWVRVDEDKNEIKESNSRIKIYQQLNQIEKYEIILEYQVSGIEKKTYITISQDNTMQDILNKIYYLISNEVKPYEYLKTWVLLETKTHRAAIVSDDICDWIPAQSIFRVNLLWKVVYLSFPLINEL